MESLTVQQYSQTGTVVCLRGKQVCVSVCVWVGQVQPKLWEPNVPKRETIKLADSFIFFKYLYFSIFTFGNLYNIVILDSWLVIILCQIFSTNLLMSNLPWTIPLGNSFGHILF